MWWRPFPLHFIDLIWKHVQFVHFKGVQDVEYLFAFNFIDVLWWCSIYAKVHSITSKQFNRLWIKFTTSIIFLCRWDLFFPFNYKRIWVATEYYNKRIIKLLWYFIWIYHIRRIDKNYFNQSVNILGRTAETTYCRRTRLLMIKSCSLHWLIKDVKNRIVFLQNNRSKIGISICWHCYFSSRYCACLWYYEFQKISKETKKNSFAIKHPSYMYTLISTD